MKQLILLLILIHFYSATQAQNGGTWTWIHGDNNTKSNGSFGTKGVASPTNSPPAKYQTAYWTDLNGNFWIFSGADDQTCDLWKYNPLTNQWTWVNGSNGMSGTNGVYGTKGVPSVNNYPAARGYGANCWTDSVGDLWLYGGAKNQFYFGDLWRYHIATNEWTWMAGEDFNASSVNEINYGTKNVPSSSNSPGKRYECKSGWIHNNQLLMFGGQSQSSDFKNDIWSYQISTNMWTWIAGDSLGNSVGNYGTKNVPSVNNVPSGRYSYTKWKKDNKIYIFAGGKGNIEYNDVWSFDLVSNEWTWIAGDNYDNSSGENPKNNCETSSSIRPSSRFENQSIQNTGCSNSFWSFGGFKGSSESYNDLWLYKLEENKWVRVSGDSTTNIAGIYGTLGVPNINNKPSSRGGIAIWNDNQNRLYVFGGYSTYGGYAKNNDLWRFEPDQNCIKYNLGGGLLSKPDKLFFCKPLDTATITINGKPDSLKISPAVNFRLNADTTKLFLFPAVKTTYTILSFGTFCNEYADTTIVTIDFRSKDTTRLYLIDCAGYVFNNTPLYTSGIYYASLFNQFGCDSLVILNFTVKDNSTFKYTKTICPGQSFLGYTLPGIYIDSFKRAGLCDSFVILTLKISDTATKIIYESICHDQSYFFNNFILTKSGKYTATLKSVNNCDSNVILNLTKLAAPYQGYNFHSICYGSYFNSIKVTSKTQILDTLYNFKKCDSVYLTHFIEVSSPPIFTPYREQIFCDTIRIKNNLYNYTFKYTDTVKSITYKNCDSIYSQVKYIQKKSAPMKIVAYPNVSEYIYGEPIILKTNPAQNIIWSTGETTQKIDIKIYEDQSYYVIGWNDIDCIDTAYIDLKAFPFAILDIPKAFAPNGKTENQTFKPNFFSKIYLIKFEIFNRWGEKIFSAKDINKGWDGTYRNQDQPAGVYTYMLEYKANRNIIFKSGEVLLVR